MVGKRSQKPQRLNSQQIIGSVYNTIDRWLSDPSNYSMMNAIVRDADIAKALFEIPEVQDDLRKTFKTEPEAVERLFLR